MKTSGASGVWLEHDTYYHRGLAAYFRMGSQADGVLVQPSQHNSGTCEIHGKLYVRIANNRGMLKVYRVKPDGFLRSLTRWPKALEEDL